MKHLARPRDAAILAAILLVVVLAWAYLIGSPGAMPEAMGGDMAGMDMAGAGAWTWREGLLLFAMWAIMMVAMMLPSAGPMILLFSRIGSGRSARGGSPIPVLFFGLGYLLVWWAFSAVAALIQWQLHASALISMDMRLAGPIGGLVLIAAGIYQWLPLKQACLRQCRTPLEFLGRSWREGRAGAVVMGVQHGTFCLGCCWLLMAVLFVAGVMNLVWIAALSTVVLVEKILPGGPAIARTAGLVFIVLGIRLIL